MRNIVTLGLALLLLSCQNKTSIGITEGHWLGQLDTMDGEKLPFNFKVIKNDSGVPIIEIYNAEEVITVDEIEFFKDSILIKLPVFEGYLKGALGKTAITGSFIKESVARTVPFTAVFNQKERFTTTKTPVQNVSGVWETVFNPTDETKYIAKGIFKQEGTSVTGTFRTTTGDYRYLEGVMHGDSIKLSTFDGAHAFLFTARVTDSTMTGTFYSGNHSKEIFTAKRNERYELPDENSLTYLKEGFEKLSFSFPDSNDTMVSLEDPQFKNKVVLVQIMGTWCPNCLDETKFLVNYLSQHTHPDLKIVGLAFETAKTKALAFKSINRLKERIGVNYPILLAQYGTSNKVKAQEKLPMLDHIISYPTTIFIDKKGIVRKIHTGFNGPATGENYVKFKNDFQDFVALLLQEEI
ncbi:TlpA disulfide reductase family protein [Arenibacter sp. GZD96]|uniref:peroxiredoxin family protein n=1 Tax=Aurantibrevibacter litoralis TaxID=3106030 RepID=UPI002B03035A|nr:TlpA disulfide reductase family protein [Arenibacter sp. GZD-96]MEA1787375.1 TlpA disulfide reductase family protein [Arenibacter sp. GZD-96]